MLIYVHMLGEIHMRDKRHNRDQQTKTLEAHSDLTVNRGENHE